MEEKPHRALLNDRITDEALPCTGVKGACGGSEPLELLRAILHQDLLPDGTVYHAWSVPREGRAAAASPCSIWWVG